MLCSSWTKSLSLLLALAAASTPIAYAQPTGPDLVYQYFTQDQLNGPAAWEDITNLPVLQGNGVYYMGGQVVVVSRDATVRAYDPVSGAVNWVYGAADDAAQSLGGAFYNDGGLFTPYICYSIVSGENSRIVALDASTGEELPFTTGDFAGVAAGTPVTSEDGQYMLTTHNTGGNKGFFSIFDVSNPGSALYTYTNDVGEPFGALGYFHSPARGYFNGGEGNTNDIFIWALDNEGTNETVGIGQSYAFQMPMFMNEALNVTELGIDRGFQASLPPIITNQGLSMYWAVSRNEHRCWVGVVNLNRFAFDQNSFENVGFPRSQPFSASAQAPPSLSSNTSEPVVYGPTANGQIYRMNYQFEEGANGSDGVPVIDTAGVVSSRILVGKDDAVVYYATPAPDGQLYQLDGATLATRWVVNLGGVGIAGDIAQSDDGQYIYTADVMGTVRAYQVAVVSAAPTDFPSMVPSEAPSLAPSVNPTATFTPTINGTYPPTASPAPSASPSAKPTLTRAPVAQTAAPVMTQAPVVQPTITIPTTPVRLPTESPTQFVSTSSASGAFRMVTAMVCAVVWALI